MPKLLFSLLIVASLSANAQFTEENVNNVQNSSFTVFQNSTHKIKVPAGYKPVQKNGFYGFVNSDCGTEIMNMTLKLPVTTVMNQINMVTIERAELEIQEVNTFVLNGNETMIISAVKSEGASEVVEYTLVTGNNESSVVVKGECLKGMHTESELKEILMTLIADL